MNRNVLIVIAVVAALVIGGLAWSFLAPADAPSAPIAAIPIELSPAPTQASAPTGAPEPTEEPYAEPTSAPAATEASAPTSAPAPTEEPTTVAVAEPIIFEIEQASSQVRFHIDEVLNGAPKTVIGVTNQVAGQIAVNPADPTTAQVGTILINARGFETDSGNRNNAIKNRILRTNEHEFITFTPTGVSGLPTNVSVGAPVTFQVSGDLTIMETTRPVTFDVTLTPVSENELTGTATTTILYPDWGIQIPRVPQVASVEEEVILELLFTARPTV